MKALRGTSAKLSAQSTRGLGELAHGSTDAAEDPVGSLQLVKPQGAFRREVLEWRSNDAAGKHSLQDLLARLAGVSPALAPYLLDRYADSDGLILDPFCGSGVVPFEAALRGLNVRAFDPHPLCVAVSRAKVSPVELAEVAVALQRYGLRKPINLAKYSESFKPFFHVETFRELLNLQQAVYADSDTRVARFIFAVALDLLHGPNPSFFSVRTAYRGSVSVDEQCRWNAQRCVEPEFRALAPRILKRTAGLLRDTFSRPLNSGRFSDGGWDRINSDRNISVNSDPRNLSQVRSDSVSLILTAPPVPGGNDLNSQDFNAQQWLRRWFADAPVVKRGPSSESWECYMNELLVEFARVMKRGSKAILCFDGSGRWRTSPEEQVTDLVEEQLGRFWRVEGVLVQPPSAINPDQVVEEGIRGPIRGPGAPSAATLRQALARGGGLYSRALVLSRR